MRAIAFHDGRTIAEVFLPAFKQNIRLNGREVVIRMEAVTMRATALADLVGAAEQPLAAFEEDPASTGNAIELGALSSMGGGDRHEYEIRYSRSPIVELYAAEAHVLHVSAPQQAVLEAAAELLRAMHPREAQTISGRVVRLALAHSFRPGEVVVQGVTDGTTIEHRYRLELGEGDYNLALNAHRQGLRVVSSGDVSIRGTYLHLDNVHDFAIVPGLPEQTLE